MGRWRRASHGQRHVVTAFADEALGMSRITSTVRGDEAHLGDAMKCACGAAVKIAWTKQATRAGWCSKCLRVRVEPLTFPVALTWNVPYFRPVRMCL